ncbi:MULTISPECIES: hypothetical protein [unclassified Corynebacterium]|uniref:hypothetical protein n=1 Tax=unclassified Corynebacterium TaxID=2624378 RepID=UPI001C46435B|nr:MULTISPECIES: hypothetical protein [unclassified Corynebacterium]MBV7281365.1 hypothetical protein [Corynebacterium sp. TAE3-ERU30]MBV7301933.1 hypothetical protein [Corynebacterium sp. TAE3-ERU2]
MRSPSRRNRGAAITVILGTAALVLAGCGGADDAAPSGSTSTTTVTEIETEIADETSADTEPTPRTEDAYLRYEAGPHTSELFAKSVRDAFAAQWVRTGNTDVSVEANSFVTGDTYTMKCSGEHIVHCTGGNNAHVYLYDKTVPAGEEGAPAYPELDDNEPQTISGVIRDLSGDEFLEKYGELYPFDFGVTGRVRYVELDEPTVLRGTYPYREGKTKEDQTYRVAIGSTPEDSAGSRLAGRDGEHITEDVSPSQCWWPNDPKPPGWALRCRFD